MKFEVDVIQTILYTHEIEADSQDEALDIANKKGFNYDESEILDTDFQVCPIEPHQEEAVARSDQETFDKKLFDIVDDLTVTQLMGIDGIYEILSEEFNNEVLTAIEVGTASQ